MSYAYYQLDNGRVAILEDNCDFPPLSDALKEPNGLVAIGADLTLPRLLSAYKQGIFPWFSEGEPTLWWSPDPRMVLYPSQLKISKSLRKTLQKSKFDIRFNTAFRDVISACSASLRNNQDGTWISGDIINAYCLMHEAGYAISAEAWEEDKLVGGCYGVKIGDMFYGESMFHKVANASKVAFVNLVQKLKAEGVGLIDCQMHTKHLASLGATEISRDDFIRQLTVLIKAD